MTIKVAFFDTETNGPRHLLQVAVQTVEYSDTGSDIERRDVQTYAAYVKPESWMEWSAHCEAVHHISREFAEREGQPLQQVMQDLRAVFAGCHVLVAHNMAFDARILATAGEATLCPVMPLAAWRVCTMLRTAGLCGLRDKRGGRKRPSLAELYLHLMGGPVPGPGPGPEAGVVVEEEGGAPLHAAHNATFDVEVLMVCFERLLEEGEMACDEWCTGPAPLVDTAPQCKAPKRPRCRPSH